MGQLDVRIVEGLAEARGAYLQVPQMVDDDAVIDEGLIVPMWVECLEQTRRLCPGHVEDQTHIENHEEDGLGHVGPLPARLPMPPTSVA